MVDTPLDRLLAIGYEDLRRNQEEFRKSPPAIDPKRTPAAVLHELEKDHPPAGQAAARLSRRPRRSAAVHREAPHRDDPVAGPADPRGDAAVHARAHHRVHGHAGTVREGRQGSVFQRHSAGNDAGRRSKSTSIWRASTAAPSSAPPIHEAYPGHYVQFLWLQRAVQGAQADRRQFERRRLGALLRADDARRGLRQRRSEAAARASCRTRCCATPATSSGSRCTPAR